MAKTVTLKVNEGKIRGIKRISAFSGAEYYSFFGVPYGQNTRGALRFKDPVKVKPWKTVLDATVEQKQGCVQYSLQLNDICGSEDCLYNNIHTPKLPLKDDPLKAVIVLMHPGALVQGSPESWQYGSVEYIMYLDVVYVGIAYRLHCLGFLNLDLDECSSNQGIKDIILGLEWIRDNIQYFGGDPNNVTLLGSSSGAVLIHNLMLTPRAQGLFHKAVMMGGYFFNPLRLTMKENMTFGAEIAEGLGYSVPDKKDKKKLLSISRKITPEQIVEYRPDRKVNLFLGTPFPVSPFLPTVDHPEKGIFPVHFRQLLPKMTRVPLIYGICEREAVAAFCRGMRRATMEHFIYPIRFNHYGWGYDLTDGEIEYIRKRLEAFYWKSQRIETAPLPVQVDVYTDLANSDLYNTLIDIVAEGLPESVFVYKFTFEGNACTFKDRAVVLLEESLHGTLHAADFSYWTQLINPWDPPNRKPSKETIQMIRTFTKTITQFAKTGDPNNEDLKTYWAPSTPEKPCYMKIDKEMQLIDGKLNGERVKFWENLKQELREKY